LKSERVFSLFPYILVLRSDFLRIYCYNMDATETFVGLLLNQSVGLGA